MGRYIVLPRESQTDRYKQRDVRLDILSRKAQMEEVRSLRSRDPVNRAVREWIGRCDPEAVTCLTTSKTDMPILSVEVVEMSDRYAERMRREIPDILVIEDTPLIRSAYRSDISTTSTLRIGISVLLVVRQVTASGSHLPIHSRTALFTGSRLRSERTSSICALRLNISSLTSRCLYLSVWLSLGSTMYLPMPSFPYKQTCDCHVMTPCLSSYS